MMEAYNWQVLVVFRGEFICKPVLNKWIVHFVNDKELQLFIFAKNSDNKNKIYDYINGI